LDAFNAYLLVRRFLRQPESRRRARRVAALMEAMAEALPEVDPKVDNGKVRDTWSVLGLLSQLDWESAADNPEARGRLAREQAELEGLDADLAKSLEVCWQTDFPQQDFPKHVHALRIADALADNIQLSAADSRLQRPLYKLGLDAAHLQRIVWAVERTEGKEP
jgi:predicted hydrolase (HD superfamily)